VKAPCNYLMGIDLGTSSAKTVIIDRKGQVVSTAAQEYEISRPQPNYAEQDPHIWVQAAWKTMRSAINYAGIDARQVGGIGISGQMHGTVCLNSQGIPLRPAIIWADQRSQAQVAEVYRKIGSQRLGEWTANPLATGFMLATWLWLLENEPRIAEQTSLLMLPKDYLRYQLTGKIGSEPSDASSTLLFNTAQRSWSSGLINALGIDLALLPAIHESIEIAGGLTVEAAAQTGLPPEIPVIYGGSDQALQALGHGIVEAGLVSCTIGSGGQLFAPITQPVYDPQLRLHLFCHVLPELWHLEAAILSAGLSLKWLRDSLYPTDTYQSLADAASQVHAGAEGLFFLPHLSGERTPHMDPQAKAAFVGLTTRHGRGHLTRAVMEGVVMALKRGLDLMIDLGVPLKRIVASGGGTRHPLWLQLQADIFNQPIHHTTSLETAAIGAAILAGRGIGIIGEAAMTSRELVHWSNQVIYPKPENTRQYEKDYRVYCQLYPALKCY
jgi:xylulokinase